MVLYILYLCYGIVKCYILGDIFDVSVIGGVLL